MARRVSKTGTHPEGPTGRNKARSHFLAQWAEDRLKASPELDLVALGHTHIPILKEVFPGRFYLNTGDWMANQSYAVLSSG